MAADHQSELEARLAAIAALAAARLPRGEFLSRVLREVTASPTVSGGGIWQTSERQAPTCIAAAGPAYERWIGNGGHSDEYGALRSESLQSGERRLIPRATGPSAGLRGTASVDSMLVHWPIGFGGGSRLIELLFEPTADEAHQRDVLRLLQQAEPIWANYLNVEGVNPSGNAEGANSPVGGSGEWDAFLLALHRSLDVGAVCFTIANDGRRLIGCDRMCVLASAGQGLRLASVSGVDLPDRRSNVVKSIEAAAAAVMKTGRQQVYRETANDVAPLLQDAFSEYADACHARSAVFVPLESDDAASGTGIGLLVAEWFIEVDSEVYAPTLSRVAEHAALGLQNALRHAEVSWARVVLPVQWARCVWFGGRRRWTTAVLLGLAIATAALLLIPTRLVVTARGQLQPHVREHVYAPLDGIVEQVKIDEGADVEQGALLLTLSNPELELERQRVVGAIETWEAKLASIGFRRLDGEDRDDPGAAERMSGDEAEIREELASLRQQLSLLEQKGAWLNVTSPLTGRVTTWNVREELALRPVHAGERLLTVADVAGAWDLELRLDERAAGHVVAALAQSEQGLNVEFLLASQPERTFTATLNDIADAVYWQQDETVSAPARAMVDSDRIGSQRAGTSVSARIECGWRSLGYVWFHSVYEAIVRRLWY
jgi:multidrug resistance efflux pump